MEGKKERIIIDSMFLLECSSSVNNVTKTTLAINMYVMTSCPMHAVVSYYYRYNNNNYYSDNVNIIVFGSEYNSLASVVSSGSVQQQ